MSEHDLYMQLIAKHATLNTSHTELLAALEELRGNISAASLVRNKWGQILRANADSAIINARKLIGATK